MSMQKPTLEGKVAFVTGGASGIGLAIARLFTHGGIHTVIADTNADLGKQAEHEHEGTSGSTAFVRADVSCAPEVRLLVERTLAEFQRLDIVVNNAGLQYVAPVVEFPEDRWITS
jgi:3-hydroxybutyrate dehydrogenase